jgi:hypothetical protein
VLNTFAATYADHNIADLRKSLTTKRAGAPTSFKELNTYGICLAKFLKYRSSLHWNLQISFTCRERCYQSSIGTRRLRNSALEGTMDGLGDCPIENNRRPAVTVFEKWFFANLDSESRTFSGERGDKFGDECLDVG